MTVAVSGTDNLIYDGTEKKPGVTVTWDGTALTADTDYTVAYADNTNAGTATLTVTIGDEQGSYTGNFSIGKATPTITWSGTSQEMTYTGNPAVITAPTVTLVNGENFSGAISYSYRKQGETAYTDGLPADVGIYTQNIQNIYDDFICRLQLHQLSCSCGHIRQSREQKHQRILESFKETGLKEKTSELEGRIQIRFIYRRNS